MKNTFRTFFYALFSALPLLLFACGQKGALFLADESSQNTKQNQQQPFLNADNPDADITPHLVTLQAITVSGKLTRLSENTVLGWQAVLPLQTDETNLIRYVIVENNLLAENTPVDMLIGYVQSKVVQGHIRQKLPAGTYLRFRSIESGTAHIPTLISHAKAYLQANPQWVRGKGKDFLTDNQQAIDLYLSVEKKTQ